VKIHYNTAQLLDFSATFVIITQPGFMCYSAFVFKFSAVIFLLCNKNILVVVHHRVFSRFIHPFLDLKFFPKSCNHILGVCERCPQRGEVWWNTLNGALIATIGHYDNWTWICHNKNDYPFDNPSYLA